MNHPWQDCDDDGYWEDSGLDVWEALEECAGPMYRMWKDKLDAEAGTPTWKPPQTYVISEDWMQNIC